MDTSFNAASVLRALTCIVDRSLNQTLRCEISRHRENIAGGQEERAWSHATIRSMRQLGAPLAGPASD